MISSDYLHMVSLMYICCAQPAGHAIIRSGITMRVHRNRVRISVPNCGDQNLVMWMFCTSGRTEGTWSTLGLTSYTLWRYIHGLNLAEGSHRLVSEDRGFVFAYVYYYVQ